MASVSTKTTFGYELVYQAKSGEEQKKRSIAFDYRYDEVDDTDPYLNFAASLVGKYNRLIQPLYWRDDDINEDEYVIIQVNPKITTTTVAQDNPVTP